MREIKFRAWDLYWKKMFPALSLEFLMDKSGINVTIPDPENKFGFYVSDNCELMQYTGLKDKNGKEIYEGDVVRMYDRPPDTMTWDLVVEWENGKFILTGIMDKGEYFGDLSDWADCDWRIEVIGNIYENPELLEAR